MVKRPTTGQRDSDEAAVWPGALMHADSCRMTAGTPVIPGHKTAPLCHISRRRHSCNGDSDDDARPPMLAARSPSSRQG